MLGVSLQLISVHVSLGWVHDQAFPFNVLEIETRWSVVGETEYGAALGKVDSQVHLDMHLLRGLPC